MSGYSILALAMVELLSVSKAIQLIGAVVQKKNTKSQRQIFSAAAKNGLKADGVELNTWLVQYSRISALYNGVFKHTKFYQKDLWKFDVSPYKYIVIFGVEQMVSRILGFEFIFYAEQMQYYNC